MLIGVQYLRAIAASLVVIQHITHFVPGGKWHMVGGGFGVDLFFLISGFVIWVSGAHMAPGEFALRRIARIVPLYWAATLIAAFFQLRNGFLPYFWPEAGDFIRSLLFIPYENPIRNADISPVLGVGWTLNLEMYFYALFTLGLVVARAHVLAFVVGVLCFVPTVAAVTNAGDPLLPFYAQSITLEFAAGMLVGWAYSGRKFQAAGWIAPAVMLALAAALLVYGPRSGVRALDFGMPAALILQAVIALEPVFLRRPWRLGVLMGDASYALYLTHALILPFFGPIVGKGLLPRNGFVTRPLAFLACIALAIAVHRWYERPVNAWFRRWLGNLRGGVHRNLPH